MSACCSRVIPPAWCLMIKWNSFSQVYMFCSPWRSVERPLPGHYLADSRSLHHTYWNQWGGTPPLRSWTSTSPSSNISHTRRLYGKERERYERQAWHIEADVCKAAQDTAPLHPIRDIQHLPIVAHPVVCFNGVITIVNGHLIQEVGITLAPHVVRVTSAICPLWNAIDAGKLGTLTKIARVRPERADGDHRQYKPHQTSLS